MNGLGTRHVSLSIALDWDHMTTADYGRLDRTREMFRDTWVDTYGREADTQTKVWIVRASTSHTYISFAQHLANIFPIDAVVFLSVTNKS